MKDPWINLFSDITRLKKWQTYTEGIEQQIHAFLQFDLNLAPKGSTTGGRLDGIPIAVKDNIAVSPFKLTCGSELLKNFVSPYTATAVEKLQAEGAVVVGKTNLDEFGMGSSTENSSLAETLNPWDLSYVPGGSSGGSAAAVAAGIVPFALGSDTGGSIRQPASFCGVYGLKPTYGAVSRYGLVAYASSLEVIGVISKTVSWAETAFSLMRGQDSKDHSSLKYAPEERKPKQLTVGVPALQGSGRGETDGTSEIRMDQIVAHSFNETRKALNKLGFTLKEIKLPTLEYVVSAYYTIASAEASANLARFDGIRYGLRAGEADNPEELVRTSRSRGLGDEVKLRILLGTFVLRSGFQDQYYLRAQRIRTAIRQDFERAFSEVDLILMPVYPCPPFRLGSDGLDPFAQKLSDVFTCSANLAGLPAMSFPTTVEKGLPIGMQFLAPAFGEQLLFQACSRFEEFFPAPDCPLFSAGWSL
jgi:aspartyl-tRNA(Asn)/glutamyl-tRNA(Gln) amidotransferase subunit A